MNNLSLPCPACGEKLTTHLGELMASSGIINLSDSGSLYQCPTCGLLFRSPYLSFLGLRQAYSELPDNLWNFINRPDYAMAMSAICSLLPSGRILDVGCYRGDFLAMLPEHYQRYGVEPASSVREVLRQRGITLIGSFIENIEINHPMFHVITLLDVIEHLPNPLTSLQRISELLLPGGFLIVSTGNSDSLPWRLMRLHYWYYFSEHVSFFNLRWFHWSAKRLNLKLVYMRKFSHFNSFIFERWYQLARCLAFHIAERCGLYPLIQKVMQAVNPFAKVNQWFSPPMAHLWRDHILVILRRHE